MAVQQLDQVRRSAFKPVLPAHSKGLAKVPPSPHIELFGDDLPTRQKELKEKADLAEKPSSSSRNRRPYQQLTPYSRPPTATSPQPGCSTSCEGSTKGMYSSCHPNLSPTKNDSCLFSNVDFAYQGSYCPSHYFPGCPLGFYF